MPGDTPTAQVCSRCGHEELVLARDLRPAWTCPECGYSYEYDDVVESDEWFEECEQCRKEFKVQVEWDPIFNTDKLDE